MNQMDNNNQNNNQCNFNGFHKEGKEPSAFYEFLKGLKELEKKGPGQAEIAVPLGENEIKRLDLVFALLRARGTSPYYTRERWMSDVIYKGLKGLEEYLLRVDGVDVSKIYHSLWEAEENRKKHQEYWSNKKNH